MFAVCAIARDEPVHYVKEWLDWHRGQGVDRFFIYNNGGWVVGGKDIEVRSWLGIGQQQRAYNHCLKYCRKADYLALIDLDEFIMGPVLKRLPSIGNALILNWKVYGTSGLEWNPYGRQMGVFTSHVPVNTTMNSHVKCIVRPKRTMEMPSSHYGLYVDHGKHEDFDGTLKDSKSFNPISKYPAVWINHYFTRSMEDWKKKVDRGRVSTQGKKKFETVYLIDHRCVEDDDDGRVVDTRLLPCISEARYGASENMLDVTDKVRDMAKNARIFIKPYKYNDIFSDPAVGKKKRLYIRFSRAGKLIGECSVDESENLIMS